MAQSGMWNSLAQTLIKIAAPGVPDFYQGTEVWNFSLVDPDNRRPVDYAQRAALLAEIEAGGGGLRRAGQALGEMLASSWTGARSSIDLARAAFRVERPEVLEAATTRPIEPHGPRADQSSRLRAATSPSAPSSSWAAGSGRCRGMRNRVRVECEWRDTTVALPAVPTRRILGSAHRSRRAQACASPSCSRASPCAARRRRQVLPRRIGH